MSLNILRLLGRSEPLLTADVQRYNDVLNELVASSRFLVLGAAGTIGQSVTKEIFKRNPEKLHAVDISENNLVELVRDVRSQYGYIKGEFRTYALDIGSRSYDAFVENDGNYDYVLNLSALKHVRSEEDPYTLMRMIEVNILNTIKTIRQSKSCGVKKYFCVSTDKATNPVNMMGGSKRIMEMFLLRESHDMDISTARFANVAFSDGSLMYGFNQRLEKQQPIVAPNDVRRYFVTPKESGELCLLSALLGDNGDIFFPKLHEELHLTTFSDIAIRYLSFKGLKPFLCTTEDEARELMKTLPSVGEWPCLFAKSNTTGEKDYEEFYTADELVDLDLFEKLGVIKNGLSQVSNKLDYFLDRIEEMRFRSKWTKIEIVDLFNEIIPNFGHVEKGIYLDSKM